MKKGRQAADERESPAVGPDVDVSDGAEGAAEPATFGEAMDRLEAIVSRLEGDEALGLEEAVALYEQGVALAGECRRRLAAAQLKLTEIPVATSTATLEEAP
ncbi:MAG: exodeoxyribonuclease VII small subunit [Chloroflexota bacterium]